MRPLTTEWSLRETPQTLRSPTVARTPALTGGRASCGACCGPAPDVGLRELDGIQAAHPAGAPRPRRRPGGAARHHAARARHLLLERRAVRVIARDRGRRPHPRPRATGAAAHDVGRLRRAFAVCHRLWALRLPLPVRRRRVPGRLDPDDHQRGMGARRRPPCRHRHRHRARSDAAGAYRDAGGIRIPAGNLGQLEGDPLTAAADANVEAIIDDVEARLKRCAVERLPRLNPRPPGRGRRRRGRHGVRLARPAWLAPRHGLAETF